jgi:hypothetical protein
MRQVSIELWYLFFKLINLFCNAEDQTLGLAHARQILYHDLHPWSKLWYSLKLMFFFLFHELNKVREIDSI